MSTPTIQPMENSVTQNQPFVEINNVKIDIEIADTQAKQELGLMNRTELCENCGMLFVFDKVGFYPFWMKNTIISLDIIFIAEDGKIVEIAPNMPTDPCIGVDETKQDCITPVADTQIPHKYVLEVNAGFCNKNNIKVGDLVSGLIF